MASITTRVSLGVDRLVAGCPALRRLAIGHGLSRPGPGWRGDTRVGGMVGEKRAQRELRK